MLTRPELINYMSNFEVSIQSQPSLQHDEQKNLEIIGDRVFYYVNYYTTITLPWFPRTYILFLPP